MPFALHFYGSENKTTAKAMPLQYGYIFLTPLENNTTQIADPTNTFPHNCGIERKKGISNSATKGSFL